MLRSDLCDYSDAYIVVKEGISVTGTDNANRKNKKLTSKDNAPFKSYISKINNAFVDNAEDLDIVVPMYNFLEYSDNLSLSENNYQSLTELDVLLIAVGEYNKFTIKFC